MKSWKPEDSWHVLGRANRSVCLKQWEQEGQSWSIMSREVTEDRCYGVLRAMVRILHSTHSEKRRHDRF